MIPLRQAIGVFLAGGGAALVAFAVMMRRESKYEQLRRAVVAVVGYCACVEPQRCDSPVCVRCHRCGGALERDAIGGAT